MRPLLDCAKVAAFEAATIILRNFNTELDVMEKSSNNLVTRADLESEEMILSSIRKIFPGHSFLAEENHPAQPTMPEHLWIIDPLDGTTNFVHGIPHFCISIAYAHHGEVKMGLVYDPLREELFTAIAEEGAFLNDKKIGVSQSGALNKSVIATGFYYDRGALMEKTLETIHALFKQNIRDMRRTGSAALDMCWVACGRFDGYFEYLLSPWDFSAAMLIVCEAGGVCVDKTGGPLGVQSGSVVASNAAISGEFLKSVEWKE
jgi:Archaeal fructose-1,6-bisphosphatase and related enzymes of inositol monophosphatase family